MSDSGDKLSDSLSKRDERIEVEGGSFGREELLNRYWQLDELAEFLSNKAGEYEQGDMWRDQEALDVARLLGYEPDYRGEVCLEELWEEALRVSAMEYSRLDSIASDSNQNLSKMVNRLEDIESRMEKCGEWRELVNEKKEKIKRYPGEDYMILRSRLPKKGEISYGIKKQELVHLHGLLAQVQSHYEEWSGETVENDGYTSLGVQPTSIHKSKTDHKAAVFALASDIVDEMSGELNESE